MIGPELFAAPFVEVVDIDPAFETALRDEGPQPRGQRDVVAENEDRLAEHLREVDAAVAEDQRFPRARHAMDHAVAAAEVPVELFLLACALYAHDWGMAVGTKEQAYLTGNGNQRPLGVFTASANGVPTSRDVSTDNTTTAITADGLINAKYSLKGQYQASASWLFHRDAIKMIAKLKDGDGQYLWKGAIMDGEPDRLLGRPVMMSEFAPNTFTTGQYVGMFADFSHYWIVDSLQLQMQRLVELYAESNQVGFIARYEGDGAPVLAEAFARVKLA
jgi:predicted phage gp36 major capsid-like protein